MNRSTRPTAKTPSKMSRIAGLFLCLTATTVTFSQLPTATILGTVKDSTGAVVPDATVTVRNSDTGLTRTEKSSANGSYRFAALPVGVYEVRAEQRGFRAEVRSGMTLAVGQDAVVNFALQVGAIEQTVEVTAEASLVNTTSGQLGAVVDERQVADLPLNGRNYVDLTLLQPGVVQHRQATVSAQGVGTWFSNNGAPPRSNYYLLDGAQMVGLWGATTASAGNATLGVEGIREWRVVTNSFSAEYGMRMGGQMAIVSKGGTNNFHGSLFEYLRNSALDARNFFDYQSAAAFWRLPPFRRNQYGGSAGGPIKKDKAFFFATYEGLTQRLGLTNLDNVIPPAAKVDGGLVPQIAPVVKPLLALFPNPNLPNDQYTFPSTQPIDEHYGQARGDYIFSSSDTAFARYTADSAVKVQPLAYPQFKNLIGTGMHLATLSDNHVFSPGLLGSFRFSFSHVLDYNNSPSGIGGPQLSLVPGQEIGIINIGGVTSLGPDKAPSIIKLNVFTYSGDLFYNKGRHSLKFGSLINHFQQFNSNASALTGNVSFANLTSFLLGQTSTYAALTPGSVVDRTWHYNSLGFYIQDDLRTKSNLTLNLGLRYEFNTNYNDVHNQGSALRDIRHDAAFTAGNVFENPSLKSFSPRFGFAWDVRGDGKTAVRGGFAEMYDVANFGGPLHLVASAALPLSSMSSVPTPSTFSLPLFFGPGSVAKSGRTMDYHIRNPHMLSYNLAVERQLPGNMALSVAYAGSRGLNLLASIENDPTIPQVLPGGRLFWTGTDPRINSNWTSVSAYSASLDSRYNSLQVLVKKRLSKGLELQSAYTWGKLIDQKVGTSNDDNGGSNRVFSTALPRQVDQGLADWSVAHNWRFNAIYHPPEISGLHGFAGTMLNGWWVSGILTAETGLPFTPTLASNRSRSQNGNDRPDLNVGRSNGNIILGGPNRYFDPLAFSIPAAGFLGNSGRNILTAPGVANLDFSLVKDTGLRFLGEVGKLEFRAEFFNILNRANFSRPIAVVYAARANVEAPLPTAGQITSTDTTSRQIQFGVKVLW